MIDSNIIKYLFPFFPLVLRIIHMLHFKEHMNETRTGEAAQRDKHRSYLLSMMSLSFAALLALVVINKELQGDYFMPIYYSLIAFLSYFTSLNIQGYKYLVWHDEIVDISLETGNLCLIFIIISIVYYSGLSPSFKAVMIIISLLIWLIDFFIRILLEIEFYERDSEE